MKICEVFSFDFGRRQSIHVDGHISFDKQSSTDNLTCVDLTCQHLITLVAVAKGVLGRTEVPQAL